MRFWDSSAIIPLCINEPLSGIIREMAQQDGAIVAWWGSAVECWSAFARLRREGLYSTHDEDCLRQALAILQEAWTEIKASEEMRTIAGRLLLNHPLRAADCLQLAAALVWAEKTPRGHHLVCLDRRLREASRKEGFVVLPEEDHGAEVGAVGPG